MDYQHIVNNIKNGVIQTPAYIFDTDILREKVGKITEILGDTAKVCYAIKANPFLIRTIDDIVPKYEVCSPGELEICRSSHISMKKVVFSGINKTEASVRTAAQYGVGVMTVESLHHFDLIAKCAAKLQKKINIILRLTNGSQFGINEEDIEDLISRRAQYPYIHMLGIQYFTGTQKKKFDHIIHELDYAEEFCARLMKKYKYPMEQFEYGTGLWVPYFTKDDFSNEFTDLTRIRDYFAAKNYPYEVILEMGRYPVASCGYFATKVEDVKTNKGANYCLIDAGIHQINYYGQNMALKTPLIDHWPMHPQANVTPQEWMMCGSLCTFNDVVARNLTVKDLQIGDYFVFHNIGAYSVTEGGYLFLSRDLPNVYFANEELGIRLVRQGIPTHILNTPDLSGRRLDMPPVKAQPQTSFSETDGIQARIPSKNSENSDPLTSSKTTVGVSKVAAAAAPAAVSVRTAAPRPSKRFAPETDVLSEAKREKETSRPQGSARPQEGTSVMAKSANSRGTASRSNRQNDGTRRSSNRRKKSNKALPLLIAAIVIVLAVCIGIGVYFSRRVLPELTVEAGTDIRTSALMRYNSDKKTNNFVLPHVDTNTPGEYKVDIRLSPFTYHSTITVKDTTAPTLQLQDVKTWFGQSVTVDDFVLVANDATELHIAFSAEPDVFILGTQQVTISAMDAAGLKTTQTAMLEVSAAKDQVEVNLSSETLPAPYEFLAEDYLVYLETQGITADAVTFAEEPAVDTSIPGEYSVQIQAGDQIIPSKIVIRDTQAPSVFADDIYITVGSSIMYKKAVRAYDNVDTLENMEIGINRDGVDPNTEGQYTYTATVTDTAGNSGEAIGTVYVLAADADVASIDEVNDMADAVLETIIEEGMTEKEKLRAIYNWIRSNTRYTTYDQESDYVLGAYDGFTAHTGNCFNYAAMAKFLLTRAGIQNIDIVKVVPEGSTDIPTHFWNLVNIGEGWYHYDVTPRKDGSKFFYLTDAELREYSDNHNYTHRYDESLYPEIQ